MSHLNPRWFADATFLVVGLIWSGGHVAWLVMLGIWTLIGFVGDHIR